MVWVEIIYNDKIEKLTVNNITVEDLMPIQYRPISEWFSASCGRDGWEGLIPEIRKLIDDESAELRFAFIGPKENARIFEDCLVFHGLTNACASSEEIAQRNLKKDREAEQQGLYQQAFEFYWKAAQPGVSVDAEYELAKFYFAYFKGEYNDKGKVCGNISKRTAIDYAVEYWEKAAEHGSVDACFRLYELFASGIGVVENQEEEAIKWLTKAVNNSGTPVQSRGEVGSAFEYRIAEIIEKNPSIITIYQRAADQNYAAAQLVLGFCYEYGKGVDKDAQKAVEWYRRAAAQNLSEAQCNLGVCYSYGNGVKKIRNEQLNGIVERLNRNTHGRNATWVSVICWERDEKKIPIKQQSGFAVQLNRAMLRHSFI